MRTEHNLNLNIAVAFSITLAIVMFIGLVSYRSINEFVQAKEIVTRSHRIMTAIEATLSDIVTAESEARGYIITGNEHYLNIYRLALAEVDEDFAELRGMVMDADMRKLVAELEQATQERLNRLKATVATRRMDGLEAVQASSGAGKKLMDDLRERIAAINTLEETLLNQRDERSQTLARYTIRIMFVGVFFAVVIAAASMAVLSRMIAQRQRLEDEILAISEREQRRIGQDLHDGLCQQLTGTALLSRSLQMKLGARSAPEESEAARITTLINDAIEQTRRVTRGLHPVVDEPSGLMQALQELAAGIHGLGPLTCRFDCPEPVPIPDQAEATHLYRIAQEAVQNAMRHAHPTAIVIGLRSDGSTLSLDVADNGCGMSALQARTGMGLAIMNHRAATLGGALRVHAVEQGGTVVTCTLPRS
jgi:signal transduction histidine kinase